MENILSLKNIKKNYGEIAALKGVSLDIERGSFLGILGPNGAGKTTLMNIIIGLIAPDEGEILLENSPVIHRSNDVIQKFGYVPQEIALYEELSAIKNLEIFGGLYGLKGKALRSRISEVLEMVGLYDRKKDAVKTFSGGMKRRFNIACSILHSPEIILCDEPTVGIDPQSRNAIFDMLQQMHKAEGKTIIYTTHYMEEAERLCDKLEIIDNGKIIAEGTLTELINLLDKKQSIKILKESRAISVKKELSSLGTLNELEFHFELIPGTEYSKLHQLFPKLESLGISEDNIEISRATLEDVFLNLTGRRLRD